LIKSTGNADSPAPRNSISSHHPIQLASAITYIGKLTVIFNSSSEEVHLLVKGFYVASITWLLVLASLNSQLKATTGSKAYRRPAYDPNKIIATTMMSMISYLKAVHNLTFYYF
jgi:hypothetical protein